MRSHKCKVCGKYLGKKLIDGTIDDSINYFCGGICYSLDWLNCWANMDKHKECVINNKITSFGKGYQQACKDIYNSLKSTVSTDSGGKGE